MFNVQVKLLNRIIILIFVSSVIEESSWSLVHTIALVSFSLSTMIEAYIYSISYIATGWVSVPRYLTALLTIWPPLWLLIGGVTMGPLSDLIGRRNTLYLTLLMYIVGAIGLTIGGGYLTLLLFLSLLLMATGGEYNTVMVATHEYFPRRVRSRVVFLVLNFTNLGGALASALAFLNLSSVLMQRLAIGLTLVITVPILYVIRGMLPESVMWLEAVGKGDVAAGEVERFLKVNANGSSASMWPITTVNQPPMWLRVLVGGLIGWAYTAGFSLMALTLGPYFLPSLTNQLILVFSIASFASGIPISLLADSVSRRLLLLASSVGVSLTSLAIAITVNHWSSNLNLFWPLYITFSVLVNAYFLTEDTLKSEYWRVSRRGTFTALVRVISLGGSIPVIFTSAYIPINMYLIMDTAIFSVGTAASILWYIAGIETGRGVSVRVWGK